MLHGSVESSVNNLFELLIELLSQSNSYGLIENHEYRGVPGIHRALEEKQIGLISETAFIIIMVAIGLLVLIPCIMAHRYNIDCCVLVPEYGFQSQMHHEQQQPTHHHSTFTHHDNHHHHHHEHDHTLVPPHHHQPLKDGVRADYYRDTVHREPDQI